jgi:hypothetical protein
MINYFTYFLSKNVYFFIIFYFLIEIFFFLDINNYLIFLFLILFVSLNSFIFFFLDFFILDNLSKLRLVYLLKIKLNIELALKNFTLIKKIKIFLNILEDFFNFILLTTNLNYLKNNFTFVLNYKLFFFNSMNIKAEEEIFLSLDAVLNNEPAVLADNSNLKDASQVKLKGSTGEFYRRARKKKVKKKPLRMSALIANLKAPNLKNSLLRKKKNSF